MSNKPLLKIGETPIHTDAVLNYMKADGSIVPARTHVLMNEIVCAKAEELGLQVTDEELQAEANGRRRALGLHQKEAFDHYLNALGITLDEWAESLVDAVLRQKIRVALGGELYMGDASDRLKFHLGYRRMIGGAVRARAQNNDVTVSDAELQEQADLRRRLLGLHSSADIKLMLDVLGMTAEDWEYELETDVLSRKLAAKGIQPILKEENAIALRATGALDELIMTGVMADLVRTEAQKRGVSITDAEFQEASDNLRRVSGLHTKKAFELKLKALEMTQEDWEDEVETKILMKKLTTDGRQLIDEDYVQKRIKAGFDFHKAVAKAIERELIRQEAAEKGLSVSDEALQKESDHYRRALGLHTGAAMKQYLDAREIDMDTWEQFLEDRALMRKVRSQVVTEDDITKALSEDKDARRVARDRLFDDWKAEQLGGAKINWV